MTWVDAQIRSMRDIVGRIVTGYSAVEMAFRETESSAGVDPFADPSLSFRQLLVLHLRMRDGGTLAFQTYQNNDTWGICMSYPNGEAEESFSGMFRSITLGDFPCGRITGVLPIVDDSGDIVLVEISVHGDTFALLAGEVYERANGKLEVVVPDESVLLFRHTWLLDRVTSW